jgi:hypothetical protein
MCDLSKEKKYNETIIREPPVYYLIVRISVPTTKYVLYIRRESPREVSF